MSNKRPAGVEIFNILTFNGRSIAKKKAVIIKEVPLEVFLNDMRVVTIACTGNHMDELAVGFLRSEGFIRTSEDVERIHISDDANKIYVHARPAVPDSASKRQDSMTVASSGAKGTNSFVGVRALKKINDDSLTVSLQQIFFLMERLLSLASLHDRTRGTHCSALADGKDVIISREDIGRHNTIDMLGGYILLKNIDCSDKIVIRTGRVSSEIVYKVWNLGIPVMISISVPTSMAINMAKEAGMTLIGAVKDGKMNIYSHSKRVVV
jgi:FdhD protein